MRRLLSEGCTCGPGLSEARFPLDASLCFPPTRVGDQADQGFRVMRVETLDDTAPPCGRLTRHGALTMADKLRFGPGWPHGRRHDVACGHRNIRDHGLGPMTAVFACPALDQARPQRPWGMRPFLGLNAGLLRRAHHVHAVGRPIGRLWRQRAEGLDRGVKGLRVLRTVMIAPRPRLLRCEGRGV
jgi:hypothetical protein